jgi:hypothetical protein
MLMNLLALSTIPIEWAEARHLYAHPRLKSKGQKAGHDYLFDIGGRVPSNCRYQRGWK